MNPENSKPKIFVFSLRGFTDENEAMALSEDGTVLHHSRYINENDIPYDFGIRGTNNTNHHEKYHKEYPGGYDAVFIPLKEIPKHKELQRSLRKFAYSDIMDEEKII